LNINDLVSEFQNHTTELIKLVNSLSGEDYDRKPSPEKWSVSEVIVHLYISEKLFTNVLNGNCKSAERNPLEKIPLLKGVFLNLESNYNAPEIIQPKTGVKKLKDDMLLKLTEIRNGLAASLIEKNPEELCLDFAHPQLGLMTRIELGHLAWYHSIRHENQIKKTIAILC